MSRDKFLAAGTAETGVAAVVETAENEQYFKLCDINSMPHERLHSVDHTVYLKLKVQKKQGLHMRPCAAMIEITEKYEGEVYAKELKKGRVVNGKSIFEFLTLAASQGTDIAFCFKYTDSYCKKQAEKCAGQLTQLFKNNFNE